MTILEKLGIDSRMIYNNIIKNGEATRKYSLLSWDFWFTFVWPTYSKMLEALIIAVEWLSEAIDSGHLNLQEDYDRLNLYLNIIKKATDMEYEEISKLKGENNE